MEGAKLEGQIAKDESWRFLGGERLVDTHRGPF